MPMSNWGVRRRVIFVAVVPMLVLAVVMTTAFTRQRLADFDDALGDRARAFARQLAAASEYAVRVGNGDILRQIARSALAEEDLVSVRIIDHEGAVLARSGLIDASFPAPLVAAQSWSASTGNILHVAKPIRPGRFDIDDGVDPVAHLTHAAERAHYGFVIVDLSLERVHALRRELVHTGIGSMLVVLLGSLLLAIGMSRGVSGPIRAVARTVDRIGHGHLHERVTVHGGGSLRSLAIGVNDMAARLGTAHDDMSKRIAAATAELRARKEEAERANSSKSRFLAAASHDLRQPMHALGLFIAELGAQPASARSQYLLGRIAAAATAMEGLLDSLLDISTLDAGVLTPARRTFALQPVLERVHASHQQSARDRGLRLRVRPSAQWTHSDPVLVERIIGNLLANAVAHTPSGTVLLACRLRGEHLRVEVRDSGPGIPAHAQASVFEEFVQLDNPGRVRTKGLGLGLAIVRRLADLLGHRLTLRSAPECGSMFAIDLPLAAALPAAPQKEASAGAAFAGVHVSIVDDDALAREALASVLTSWGCTVAAHSTTSDFVAQGGNRADRFQVLISDFRLGGSMDGIALIEQLRQHAGASAWHCILISGDTGADTRARARGAGIALLHKPVRAARLRALLQRMLNDI